MAREILSSPTPVAAPQPAAAPAPAASVPSTAAPSPDRDALAGALPAWDLLPGSPFVRRVK